MQLPTYLMLLEKAEATLADGYRIVAEAHGRDAGVRDTCTILRRCCLELAEALRPVGQRYAAQREQEPDRLHPPGLPGARGGPVGLLRDLQDLYQLASLVDLTWAMVHQAAHPLRDAELLTLAARGQDESGRQLALDP